VSGLCGFCVLFGRSLVLFTTKDSFPCRTLSPGYIYIVRPDLPLLVRALPIFSAVLHPPPPTEGETPSLGVCKPLPSARFTCLPGPSFSLDAWIGTGRATFFSSDMNLSSTCPCPFATPFPPFLPICISLRTPTPSSPCSRAGNPVTNSSFATRVLIRSNWPAPIPRAANFLPWFVVQQRPGNLSILLTPSEKLLAIL